MLWRDLKFNLTSVSMSLIWTEFGPKRSLFVLNTFVVQFSPSFQYTVCANTNVNLCHWFCKFPWQALKGFSRPLLPVAILLVVLLLRWPSWLLLPLLQPSHQPLRSSQWPLGSSKSHACTSIHKNCESMKVLDTVRIHKFVHHSTILQMATFSCSTSLWIFGWREVFYA